MNTNYQKTLENAIKANQELGKIPTLLLHSCCAPCSTYVLEYLSQYFRITVFFYNPNLYPSSEYEKRMYEQEYFLQDFNQKSNGYAINFLAGDYDPTVFYRMARGLEEEPEGGERCFRCYEQRLREAARVSKESGFDYFTTTLSISPMKNAQKLNEIGGALGEEYGVPYLFSDFKKKGGFLRSAELSKEYGLYRQDYCGCVFSQKERNKG